MPFVCLSVITVTRKLSSWVDCLVDHGPEELIIDAESSSDMQLDCCSSGAGGRGTRLNTDLFGDAKHLSDTLWRVATPLMLGLSSLQTCHCCRGESIFRAVNSVEQFHMTLSEPTYDSTDWTAYQKRRVPGIHRSTIKGRSV